MILLGGQENFERWEFRMIEISNYKINERDSVGSPILRESLK